MQLGKLGHEIGRIRAVGAAILVIGDDAILDAKRTAAEVGPDVQLLMDRAMTVAHRYGMTEPNRAIALIGYVVIDRTGKVLARRVDPRFGEHGDEVVKLVHEGAQASALR